MSLVRLSNQLKMVKSQSDFIKILLQNKELIDIFTDKIKNSIPWINFDLFKDDIILKIINDLIYDIVTTNYHCAFSFPINDNIVVKLKFNVTIPVDVSELVSEYARICWKFTADFDYDYNFAHPYYEKSEIKRTCYIVQSAHSPIRVEKMLKWQNDNPDIDPYLKTKLIFENYGYEYLKYKYNKELTTGISGYESCIKNIIDDYLCDDLIRIVYTFL